MELITKAPKGTVDIVPGKSEKWQVVEDVFRSEAELNGFGVLFGRGVADFATGALAVDRKSVV